MILAVSLVILLFASDASCQTVVTYSSKISEELICSITDDTFSAIWTDQTTTTSLANYVKGRQPEIEIVDKGSKYTNFMFNVSATSFSLFIQPVQAEDGGAYGCATIGGGDPRNDYTVVVEVIPGTFSLDCFVPPDIPCPEQGVNPPSELICVCAANGVRPGTLYLDIPDAHTAQQNGSIKNDKLFDLRLKATVPVAESMSEVTCSVEGYNTSEPIPSELITTTFMISPPTCSLDISFDQECKVATLTCSCSASPTDGESPSDKGMVYSYFNGTGHMIESATTNTVQTNDVAAGAVNTYSCRGCNGIYYGDTSNVTKSSECTISTTALPTTTIVTTAPLSTNEPTSTKATDATTNTMHTEDSTTESTTEKSESTTTKKPVPPPSPWVIILSSAAALVVCGCGVLIIICLCKKGEDDSKPSDLSVADGNVTATNINITSSEPPAPVYGVVKKDSKKKSDKPGSNGAGPGVDPEIPTNGINDKNMTKDQAPAPHSSMRDSTNSSKPKQDMEMQYADLDHGNKPPSDKVRKPKEEPTEYATVQPVIV